MPGAGCTHGPRATKKHAAEPQVQPEQPAFPAQWFYGLYVLSPVTRLCCHRCLAFIRRVAPALGRQDHTTSPSASRHSSRDAPRPSHPASNVRDDREAPLLWRRDARMIVVICPTTQAKMCTTGSLRMAGMRSCDSFHVIASSLSLLAMTTTFSAVLPGRRASGEPGIHSHRLWLWIPGLRLAAHPGMTTERMRRVAKEQD